MQPHIFILTLNDAFKRRKALLASLDKMGLLYELWYGIDGRTGLLPEYERLIDRVATKENLGRVMADAEYACALSHNQIYQEIITRGLHGAIVLEDDVCLDDEFFSLVQCLREQPCELLFLGHNKGRFLRKKVVLLKSNHLAYKVVMAPYGAFGYYLTLSAARKFVQKSKKLSGPADWPCDITSLDCRAIMPRVVKHLDAAVASSHLNEFRNAVPSVLSSKRFLRLKYWQRCWFKYTGKKLN